MITLLLLAACAPCGPIDEIEVEASGDPEVDAEIHQGIADIAAWTGREGVCVNRVGIKDLRGRKYGHYDSIHRTAWIDPELPEIEATTRHELCHGLDAAEHLSRNQGSLLKGGDPGRVETFAQACELGAPYSDAILALEAECGATTKLSAVLNPELRAWLDEVVFLHPDLTIRSERVAAGKTRAVGLDAVGVDGGWGHGLLLTSESVIRLQDRPGRYEGQGSLFLVEHDLQDGRLRRTIPIRGSVGLESTWMWLIGSSETAVVVRNQLTVEAWRVDLASGISTPMALPGLGIHDSPRGAVVEDRLYYSTSVEGEIVVLDLQDQSVETVQTGAGWIRSIRALEDGVLVTTTRSQIWLGQDGSWGSEPLPPSPWDSYDTLALSDGRLLLVIGYLMEVPCVGFEGTCAEAARAWLVGDGDGSWSLVDPLCEVPGEPLVAGGELAAFEGDGDEALIQYLTLD